MILKTIAALISALFRPRNVFNIPAGQQGVDPTGANGLIGLMFNVNASIYGDMASYSTSGNAVTIAAGDIVSNPILIMGAGASGAYTITLPTTAQMLSAFGPSVPQDGSFTKVFSIVPNGAGQTGTLTAGDTPTSIVGAAVIGSNVVRTYALRVLGSAIVITNLGFNFL